MHLSDIEYCMPTLSQTCTHSGCKKRASFNVEGMKRGIRCAAHKLPDMINVVSKRCLEPGCMKQPTYNVACETKALFCNKHKLPDMINVINKRCLEPGCTKQPYFNVAGETKGLFCNDHKLPDMIDVKNKRCLEPGCMKIPSYNVAGETKGLYCNDHKKPDMIDVVSKRCLEPGCMTIPNYNVAGETKALYCKDHKLPDMIDVKNKRCLTPLCSTQVSNPAYEGHCLAHFVSNSDNHGKPVYRNYKTKEKDVVDRIKAVFPNVDWRADRRITDGCSGRRPDLFLDMGSHICIIEIDEDKHEAYDCSCENKRIQDIWTDVGCRPIIFIRFNPDAYTDVYGIKHQSCWKRNKLDVVHIQKSKVVEWQQRIETLVDAIRVWMVMVPDKPVETVELFY